MRSAVTNRAAELAEAIYNTRKFVDTGSFRDALVGNGPLIINKRTRLVRMGLTGQPVEEQLDRN